MGFRELISVNIWRRKLLKRATNLIGKSPERVEPINPETVKRVLISRPNHRLGNMLLITPLVQEVSDVFPNCKVDLFVKGNLAPIVFQNYTKVDHIIKLPKKHFKEIGQYVKGWLSLKKENYDLVINFIEHSSSGRISTQLTNSKYKFFGGEDRDAETLHIDSQHQAKQSVYKFRNYLSDLGLPKMEKPIPSLDLKLTPTELSHGKKLLQELIKKPFAKTISIFTYATGLKRHSEEWWTVFHENLKIKYPDYNIIEVLPAENVSQIAFKEPSFYSMDVREIGAVIANTDIFIGADSGIMHLSSAVQTPTIGLFMTDPVKYTPYANGSLGINTKEVGFDQILVEMEKVLEKKPNFK